MWSASYFGKIKHLVTILIFENTRFWTMQKNLTHPRHFFYLCYYKIEKRKVIIFIEVKRMKRMLVFFVACLLIFLCGCEGTGISEDPLKVGYSVGADFQDFSGFLAFTIENPVGDAENSVIALFEYGHDYDLLQLSGIELVHTVVVFVSSSTVNHDREDEANNVLFEDKIPDFMSEEYRCDVDQANVFSTIEFHKSFQLSISLQDVPYEKGMLYFVMYQGDFDPGLSLELPRVYQVVYFTNVDGVLTFTKTNPFNSN